MIEIVSGNLLEAEVEALVNPVNCVGVMGKGLALQFKQAFPDNFKAYRTVCIAGDVIPGRMFIYDNGCQFNHRYIINFPTKRHWNDKSRIDDIAIGLQSLVKDINAYCIQSIAIPPLGCGLGGLDLDIVEPIIKHVFSFYPDVHVLLFKPINHVS